MALQKNKQIKKPFGSVSSSINHLAAITTKQVDAENIEYLPEKRHNKRYKCLLVVDYAAGKRSYRDFVRNISSTGAFIDTPNKVQVQARLTLVMSLPGCNYRASAKIIRTTSSGFAIKFDMPMPNNLIKDMYYKASVGPSNQLGATNANVATIIR